MATIYVSRQGATLRKTGERLKVTIRKETLADVPLIKVSQVVVFGKASITAATLAELLNKQIEVCYLTQKGRYIGRVQPEFSKNSLLRIAQYKASVTPKHALSLAKSCVVGKLSNMRALLLRTMRDRPIKGGEKAAKRIQSAITKARRARTLDQARGHEGDGSAAYFSVFNGLITNTSFSFDKRVRRPPTDPVNVLLSFGYALLLNELYAAVNIVGFDPYIGYLHADKYGKPSLPLDLMEEFRPVIVDMTVLTCLNHKMLTLKDFSKEPGNVYRLNDKGREVFLTQYEERKMSEFQHPVLKQKITYHRCFEQQARFFAKALQGELPEYTPLRIR